MDGHYDEFFGHLTDDEATRRFGQKDHVRLFGIKDINLHLGKIMRVNSSYNLSDFASADQMDKANIPLSERSGMNGSTIFVSAKSDCLLLG